MLEMTDHLRATPWAKETEMFFSRQMETPAFIYVERALSEPIALLRSGLSHSGVQILFSVKSFAVAEGLRFLARQVDGFSTSSLFEAQLSRDVLGSDGLVQFVSPGINEKQIAELAQLCDRMTVNSLSQWQRFKHCLRDRVQCGIRVNPTLSFTDDDRYNPCRKYSKLGVPIDDLAFAFQDEPKLFQGISGIHFHNNCISNTWLPLLATVEHIEARLEPLLRKVEWINLGGGYEFSAAMDFGPLNQAIEIIKSKYQLDVFLEPGAGIVNSGCYIVASIIDMFKSDGKMIAVLDTTVNHMPEVFEYQFQPDIIDHRENGSYEYILAGCSCLPGDVFGEYAFDSPLEIGSQIVFCDVGAYTLVKANMFNGINLPTIYALKETGELEMTKRFTYQDFVSRCGAESSVTI
jgi:carboxynorspermidine decarboxylase